MKVPVPETLKEALSPQWLTAALQTKYPDIVVTAVVTGEIDDRITTNALFVIETADELPPDLPANLCIKGYFNDLGREARQVGESEVIFYRDLAGPSGVRTLRSVYADLNPVDFNSVIITEDVAVQGAVFLDGNSKYTPDQTAESLEQLAKLHAATWENPRYADASWLAPRMNLFLEVRGVPVLAANLAKPLADRVPAEVRDAQRLADVLRAEVERDAATLPWCVNHGDVHPGNVYLDGAGRPSFLDWQLVQRGSWNVDVGYHIAATLSVDDRRDREDDLLRHYLDRLTSLGVEAPSWEQARPALRHGIVHGYYLWAITEHVKPPIIAELLERLGTAAADHEALS